MLDSRKCTGRRGVLPAHTRALWPERELANASGRK